MNLRYYGHSAFLLTGQAAVLFDPFDVDNAEFRLRGLRFDYEPIEPIEVDVVLVSHDHFDHNNVASAAGAPLVLVDKPGTFESRAGDVIGIASEHDDRAGTVRGSNTIYCVDLDGIRVCHLGDLGQAALRPEQIEAIGESDVLLVPVGGRSTLSGEQAAAAVRAVRPKLALPMHYRTDATNWLEPIDSFVDALDARATRVASTVPLNEVMGTREAPSIVLPQPPLRTAAPCK